MKEVSDLFVDIFLNFNVVSQTEKIKKLNREERLILLILSADVFSEENNIVIQNFEPFKEELILINDSLEKEYIEDQELKMAISVDIFKLRNNGEGIPKPLSEEEATIKRRDIEISNILKDNFGDT